MPTIKSPRDQIQPFIDFAFVEFGMSERDFLNLEPIRWEGIMEAWLNKERRLDRRTARICVVLGGGTEEDYMPASASDNEEQTVDEMFAVLEAVGTKSNGK